MHNVVPIFKIVFIFIDRAKSLVAMGSYKVCTEKQLHCNYCNRS